MSGSKYLEINDKTNIIIYGAAGNGMRGFHSLKTINGYNVIGFIDKRADEIKTQFGLPVWKVDERIDVPKKQCVVCVCIKNVFEHEQVVSELITFGFQYFIFKSLKLPQSKRFKEISSNYDLIFNDTNREMEYQLKPIPKIKSISIYELKDYALIKKDNGVIANIPLEVIFSDASNWDECLKNSDMKLNSAALVPQISLFRYFCTGNGNSDLYLNHCASTIRNSEKKYGENGKGTIVDTPAWRESILSNRMMVFQKMNESLELDYHYFENNAPECFGIDENKLIIMSAKHRLAFFIAKKRRFIPVKISQKDYEEILNRSAAKKLLEYFENKHIIRLSTPIQHPYFYKYQTKTINFYEEVVYPSIYEVAAYFAGKSKTNELIIIDLLKDYGTIARCYSRMGFNAHSISTDEDNIAEMIDALMHVKTSIIKKAFECDVLFANEQLTKDTLNKTSPRLLFEVGNSKVPKSCGYGNQKKIGLLLCEGKSVPVFFYTKLK